MSIEENIDRSPLRAFLGLSALYFLAVFVLSSMKLLWLDELITLHIAKLSGPGAIWDALARGADPNPPVTHLLVHYSRMIFGDHEFAYRLPAALGYWVGLVSLFEYLRHRVPATWALGGTILSMAMAAFEYSYESRSYGIFYGLAMLAFFCWTRAIDAKRGVRDRTFALVGMMFALAAGISTNYFAVLAFLPIAAGEFVRTLVRTHEGRDWKHQGWGSIVLRAIDWRIWVAMLIAALPLLVYRPLIEHSIAQFAPYAWNKVSLDQVADSYTQMVEMTIYPILALFAFAILIWILARRSSRLCAVCRETFLPRWMEPMVRRDLVRLPIPMHEAAAVLFFMMYPILGYIVASIRGGMLSPRFVIPVCFGFAIAATLVAFQLFGSMRRAGMVFVCFFLAWFLCRESVVGYWYEEQKQCFYKVLEHLHEAEANLPPTAPIAIPDPLLALTFQHYAPPQVAARVVFPVDFPAIRRFRHDDSPEENLWAGRGFLYSLKIMPVAEFQNSAHQYLIIANDQNWYLQDLRTHNYLIERLPINARASNIGGFTPLAHGTPMYYEASWDNPLTDISSPLSLPLPFREAENLPNAVIGNGAGL